MAPHRHGPGAGPRYYQSGTGRRPRRSSHRPQQGEVALAIGEAADLLVVTLDITQPAEAEAAVQAAADRFSHLDVLANNAANLYASFFEALSPAQMNQQLATSFLGPMDVTRAVLPMLRQHLLHQTD